MKIVKPTNGPGANANVNRSSKSKTVGSDVGSYEQALGRTFKAGVMPGVKVAGMTEHKSKPFAKKD